MADKQSDMFLRAKNAFRAHPLGAAAPAAEILEEANIPRQFADLVETARKDFMADLPVPPPGRPGHG